MRRAKIVCTLGPASRSVRMLEGLLQAGMNVARLNFSHGTHEEHARTIETLRALDATRHTSLGILADLQGPKIRTGVLVGHQPVVLQAGRPFRITTRNVAGDLKCVQTTYKRLPQDVRRGDRILLADGSIELRVVRAGGADVDCEILNGGELGEHQGINLPGVRLRTPALTPKDRIDLAFAIAHGVDYVALSFVRTPEDVLLARRAIARLGKSVPIIAKLEKPEAIENLDGILKVSDGVMVARGDLGVEMSLEQVPVVQKQIISRARDLRLPVITATQMLESMTQSPRPTRAEASDVANAILDGTDAVMLSAETAVGRYPLEAVRVMDRIIRAAEASGFHIARPDQMREASVAETISESICHAAEELRMKVIAVFTESGSTARLVSKHRPNAPIIAFAPSEETRRRLSLLWGVIPCSIGPVSDIDDLAMVAERRLKEERLVSPGDVFGVVAGTPFGTPGSTNFIKIHTVSSRRGTRS